MAWSQLDSEVWLYLDESPLDGESPQGGSLASTMNSFGQSRVRILSAEQSRRILEICRRIAPGESPRAFFKRLAAPLSEVLEVKVAILGNVEGKWELLSESHTEPPIPTTGAAASIFLDRCRAALEHGVQAWSHEDHDWTLVGMSAGTGMPVVLGLEHDWTTSAAEMIRLAQHTPAAESVEPREPASPQPMLAHVSVTTHRLTRKLARATGLREISAAVLQHVVRAVPSRLASFAVPTEGDQLTIVATHGYPLELVESVRITPGSGVIGLVYQNRAPLCVPDVTVFPGLQRRRPRYRTNSFVAVPISAGANVLGVVCVADRLDNAAFTRQDVRKLLALTAPAALALAREKAEQQAEAFAHASVVDPVSGLFNRRYFHTRLEEELQRAQRHKTPVALLMIDIDNFKEINDRFGHIAGDTVVRGIAEILRRSLRKFDLCSRFGGDEFAIVMPGSGPESAGHIAERVRQRIQEYKPEDSELKEVGVTVSIGLSVTYDLSARELIGRADQAMYAAKRSGKNRVIEAARARG
jgi:diguanylate cyclase (GGDEF)-like protein